VEKSKLASRCEVWWHVVSDVGVVFPVFIRNTVRVSDERYARELFSFHGLRFPRRERNEKRPVSSVPRTPFTLDATEHVSADHARRGVSWLPRDSWVSRARKTDVHARALPPRLTEPSRLLPATSAFPPCPRTRFAAHRVARDRREVPCVISPSLSSPS
jgi:hypothetical protein